MESSHGRRPIGSEGMVVVVGLVRRWHGFLCFLLVLETIPHESDASCYREPEGVESSPLWLETRSAFARILGDVKPCACHGFLVMAKVGVAQY